MIDRFFVACCIFSFISGMFVAHLIEQGRGCRVETTKGQVTVVMVGERND